MHIRMTCLSRINATNIYVYILSKKSRITIDVYICTWSKKHIIDEL